MTKMVEVVGKTGGKKYKAMKLSIKTKRRKKMAELSLFLTNANVSLGQTMEPEKVSGLL